MAHRIRPVRTSSITRSLPHTRFEQSGGRLKHSRFTIALGLSLLLPVALIVANSIHYAERPILGSPGFLMANWLYMGFPQLLWGCLALIFGRALSRNRMPTLVALDLLLTCFQLWIWYAVPRRDGADAWILYIPLWLLVLMVASSIAWIGARRERRLRD